MSSTVCLPERLSSRGKGDTKTRSLLEKRGCAKSVHMALLIYELKGCYNIVLNIHLKFKGMDSRLRGNDMKRKRKVAVAPMFAACRGYACYSPQKRYYQVHR